MGSLLTRPLQAMGICHLQGEVVGAHSTRAPCSLSTEETTQIQPCAGISSVLLSQREGCWDHLSLLLIFPMLEAKYNLL